MVEDIIHVGADLYCDVVSDIERFVDSEIDAVGGWPIEGIAYGYARL